MTAPPWHAQAPDDVAAALAVDPAAGLAAAAAARRVATHGVNRLAAAPAHARVRHLLASCVDVSTALLLAAAAVATALGERANVGAILTIVTLNASLGLVQGWRAERAMRALRALAAPLARVRRDGATCLVETEAVVPGDVLLLRAGDLVPADARLVLAIDLRTDESALTGEAQPVDKRAAACAAPEAPLGDRPGMVYRGTIVTHGRGEGVAVATGMATELGRVAALTRDVDPLATPLQRRVRRLAQRVGVVVATLCTGLVLAGLARGEPLTELLVTALSIAVAAVPEALPAVVTVALALGARRLAARHVIVRNLPAVETLGSVTTLCVDKTGTLTEHRLEVARVLTPDGGPPDVRLAQAMALHAEPDEEQGGTGDPTEAALVRHARAAGGDVEAWRAALPRVHERPFAAERGVMHTVHAEATGGFALFLKGAPERVLPCCTDEASGQGARPLDAARARSASEAMAADGLRVLAVAARTLPPDADRHAQDTPQGCTLLGLVGLRDRPRAAARAAVEACVAAGIRVRMVTGDHPETATAVAREVGLLEAGDRGAVTPREGDWSPEGLARLLRDDPRVFARVAPEHKIALVRALQRRGEVVAMTGDGVNDAPALEQADIGVAMGRIGTDAAREAADLVFTDDDLATLVTAVHEGRRLHDNIRKFIRYVLTGNVAELCLLVAAPLAGLPAPLSPLQILWVNLVTDGLPGLALTGEPADADVLRRPPRAPGEGLLARGTWQYALVVGAAIGACAIAPVAWGAALGSSRWHSMAFTVIAWAQLLQAHAVRAEGASILRPRAGNRALAVTTLLTGLVQLAVLYAPPAQRFLGTQPLAPTELAACALLSLGGLLAAEGWKAHTRRARGLARRRATRAPCPRPAPEEEIAARARPSRAPDAPARPRRDPAGGGL